MNTTQNYLQVGARGRTRTGTVLPPRDFKSLASTNFATRANNFLIYRLYFSRLEARAGIEPTYTALQAAA